MNSSVLTASLTGRIQFFYDVALLRTTCCSPTTTDSSSFHPPLGPAATSRRSRTRCGFVSRSERRVRAPGRRSVRDVTCLASTCLRWRSGRPRADGGARPARDRSELMRSRIPHRNPLPPRACEPHRPQPVSAAQVEQSACQSPHYLPLACIQALTRLGHNDLLDTCHAM